MCYMKLPPFPVQNQSYSQSCDCKPVYGIQQKKTLSHSFFLNLFKPTLLVDYTYQIAIHDKTLE